MKTYFTLLGAALVFTMAGCSRVVTSHPTRNDTWRLDFLAQHDAQAAPFVDCVKRFYQALENKDWPTSYDMRTSDFKQDMTRAVYLKGVADEGRGWSLESYKVLNVQMEADANGDFAAQLIMEFNESGSVSQNAARWKKENGKWLCEEPGLGQLGITSSMRAPQWFNK